MTSWPSTVLLIAGNELLGVNGGWFARVHDTTMEANCKLFQFMKYRSSSWLIGILDNILENILFKLLCRSMVLARLMSPGISKVGLLECRTLDIAVIAPALHYALWDLSSWNSIPPQWKPLTIHPQVFPVLPGTAKNKIVRLVSFSLTSALSAWYTNQMCKWIHTWFWEHGWAVRR